MALFVQDSFTEETTTQLLTNHTGEVGATWTAHPASAYTPSVIYIIDRLFHSTSGVTSVIFASGVPASADYKVSAGLAYVSNNGTTIGLGVAGRVESENATYYFARYSNATSGWQLFRMLSGTSTLIGSSTSPSFSPGQSKTISLILVGDQISIAVDNVVVIGPVTDTLIAGAGKAAVRGFLTTASTTTTGMHLDWIEAEDLGLSPNTQVNTSPGPIAVSGAAPSLAFSGAVTSSPGVGALTITPQAAEILFSGAVASQSQPGSLSLVPQAPRTALSGAVTSATLPGSLAFSGLAGQILISGSAAVTVATAAGTLGLTGAAPSAAYSGTVRAQTLPGLLALAGVAPGLLHSGAVTVELLAGELSIDGQAVETTIGGGIRVETAAGLLSLLGDAPSVVISGGVRVETQPGTMALTGAAPVMIHAGLIEIVTAAGGLSIAGLPVTVSAGERLGPIFAPGLHSITVQRAVLSVTPVRGLRRFDGH